MKITDVKIQRINVSKSIKALVSVTLYSEIVVHDVKVVQGAEKIFVAMPSRKEDGGRYLDIVHPVSSEARLQIEETVLNKYNEHMQKLEDKKNYPQE